MATRQKLTVSVQPMPRRPNSAQRLAAQAATLSTKQAELKREAAERRAKQASNTNASMSPSSGTGGVGEE